MIEAIVKEGDNKLGCEITIIRRPIVAWDVNPVRTRRNQLFNDAYYIHPISVDGEANSRFDKIEGLGNDCCTFWAVEDYNGVIYVEGEKPFENESAFKVYCARHFDMWLDRVGG